MPRIIIDAAVRSSIPAGRAMTLRHAGTGDAVADRKAAHVGSDRVDHARAFEPDAGGKRFHRMHAAPHQHVAIVDGDRHVAHAHLSGTGRPHFDVFEAQHLGAAVLMETKRLAHASSFDRRSIMSARSSSALKRGCAAMCGDSTTLLNLKSSSSRRPGAS